MSTEANDVTVDNVEPSAPVPEKVVEVKETEVNNNIMPSVDIDK